MQWEAPQEHNQINRWRFKMAGMYTKTRSVESPHHMEYGERSGRSSAMKGKKPYGWDNDSYQRMPMGSIKELKDGTHSTYVSDIQTDTEKYDMGRMKYDSIGMKGYARQAYDYDY